ncbi:MAG: sugar ABC transporter permease [Bifidobacteriaceae bacterium]|nr:sugar ABC transporter permease [Bifidobacteriaceae bacterium]
MAPAAVVYAAWALYPLTQTAWLSLLDWDGLTAAKFVGVGNYVAALGDPRILRALTHSLVFVFFYCLLPCAVGLAFAGIMTRVRVRAGVMFRAILFIPQVLSTVVIAVAWRWIYAKDGPLNGLLDAIGLGRAARAWLGDFTFALPAVGLIGTWVMSGLCMVLFVAGVQKIPQETFEAARLDGAGPVREFFAITLPSLRGELSVALIFTVTFALRNFDIVWNTTTGGPGDSTKVPSVFIYSDAFMTHRVGMAAAIGILVTILILGVTGLIIGLVRPREPRKGWR